jgi:hypothetical protein
MRLLQKQFSKRRRGNANLVGFEQIAIMQIEIIHSSLNGALLKNGSKERIGRIEFFDLFKSQNMKIQTS